MTKKYIILLLIVIFGVAADLVTKQLAIDHLASPYWDHTFVRTVPAEADGNTLEAWAAEEFGVTATDEDAPTFYMNTFALGDGTREPQRLNSGTELKAGERLQFRYREIEVVPGFWRHIYVRNHGAAWGMFSKHSEAFRIPFFITVSIVAMGFVMSIFRKLREDQYLLIVTLSFIVAGAIGNFVDRMRFGYVVDFIDWYVAWGGRDRHWPTFNIADVWISCGVTLMIIQSLFVKDLIPEGATAAEPAKDTNKSEPASGEREG